MSSARPRFQTAPSAAFTLIELLVVVGILGILAVLSASNYSAAVIRAKHTRVKSDLRVLAGAIEAYHADQNRVPRMAHARFYNDAEFDYFFCIPVNGVISRSLTTPVSYLTTHLLGDPFMKGDARAPLDEVFYTYHDMGYYVRRYPKSKFWMPAFSYYGAWRVGSVGPDKTFDHGFKNSAQLPYDPTNGAFSLGNIWRSAHRADETSLPPIPTLLDPH